MWREEEEGGEEVGVEVEVEEVEVEGLSPLAPDAAANPAAMLTEVVPPPASSSSSSFPPSSSSSSEGPGAAGPGAAPSPPVAPLWTWAWTPRTRRESSSMLRWRSRSGRTTGRLRSTSRVSWPAGTLVALAVAPWKLSMTFHLGNLMSKDSVICWGKRNERDREIYRAGSPLVALAVAPWKLSMTISRPWLPYVPLKEGGEGGERERGRREGERERGEGEERRRSEGGRWLLAGHHQDVQDCMLRSMASKRSSRSASRLYMLNDLSSSQTKPKRSASNSTKRPGVRSGLVKPWPAICPVP
ncbi:LOW QUALITY PROTEIN: hypothetical protein CRUP_005992 [Coryphaenoides rupestris]|nr:LOW QUALITY PROTEIN: hypothetical protein CRUP_005992 [Coryphaenoides rupestris]